MGAVSGTGEEVDSSCYRVKFGREKFLELVDKGVGQESSSRILETIKFSNYQWTK
jgi:hypothetical protein